MNTGISPHGRRIHGVSAILPATLWLVAALCLVASRPARAQDSEFQLHGYLKKLGIVSRSVFSDETRYLDITRLRLQGIGQIEPHLRSEVWLDTEALAGSFLGTVDFDIARRLGQREWLDLDWDLITRSELFVGQRIFRAFASLYAGPMTLTVGRQRIAWGTGFAWNPTDLLNPFNPAAIELGEKAGVDAIHLSVATGDFSRIEATYAPADASDQSSAAARVSSNVGEYDVSVMGGYFRDDWVVGGDFAGYVGDAGLRGEAAVTFRSVASNYVRFTLTADRSFSGGYYAFVEYYYNGQGTTDKSKYDFVAVLRGRSFNVARDYLAVSVSKTLTPLFGANVYALVNLDDRSALMGPAFTYSVSDNAEAGVAVYFFAGEGDTEFGRQRNAYFGYLQIFF